MKRLFNLLIKLSFLFKKNYWVSLSSKIDKHTFLEGYNRIFKGANVYGSHIGLGTYIGKNSFLPKVDIGRFCTIGPDVKVIVGKHPSHTFASIHPAFYSLRKQAGFTFVDKQKFVEFTPGEYFAKIGNDVWIGSDVLIMEGVEIGDGAIVGSGAVVSKNLEPYSVNVGNPIKEIRKRFEDKEIEKLLKLKWWDKDLDWIKSNASKFEDVKNVIK